MFKLLIFDLDGTLVDSAPDIIATANQLMEEIGRPRLSDEVVKASIGMGTPHLVKSLFANYSKAQVDELTRRFFTIYEGILLDRTLVYPGIENFLRTLGPGVKFAVATNKAEDLARQIISRSTLGAFPWLKVLGGDTLARQKPDPLPLLHLIELAGVTREETVMIGDGLPDMRAARRCGIHSVGINFGYSEPAALRAESPSVTIEAFSELTAALTSISKLPPRTPSVD